MIDKRKMEKVCVCVRERERERGSKQWIIPTAIACQGEKRCCNYKAKKSKVVSNDEENSRPQYLS